MVLHRFYELADLVEVDSDVVACRVRIAFQPLQFAHARLDEV